MAKQQCDITKGELAAIPNTNAAGIHELIQSHRDACSSLGAAIATADNTSEVDKVQAGNNVDLADNVEAQTLRAVFLYQPSNRQEAVIKRQFVEELHKRDDIGLYPSRIAALIESIAPEGFQRMSKKQAATSPESEGLSELIAQYNELREHLNRDDVTTDQQIAAVVDVMNDAMIKVLEHKPANEQEANDKIAFMRSTGFWSDAVVEFNKSELEALYRGMQWENTKVDQKAV